MTYAPNRENPWRQLGHPLHDAATAAEALEDAYLSGWNVRKAPLEVARDDGSSLRMEDTYGVIRDSHTSGPQALAVVGRSHRPVQNEEYAPLLDAIKDESGAQYDSAGQLDNGRKIFVTLKLPGSIKVGGIDRVDSYLTLVAGHDGQAAPFFVVTPVRDICKSAFSATFATVLPRITCGDLENVLATSQRVLDDVVNYLEDFQAVADGLARMRLQEGPYAAAITREYGAPAGASDATVTRSTRKLDSMMELYRQSSAPEGLQQTAWAGLCALYEWFDYYGPVRANGAYSEADARARRAVLDTTGFKDHALKIMERA